MISKELFKAVMGYSPIGDFPINNGLVDLQGAENDFFFKCKEWVLEQGYRIIIDCSKDIKVGIRILKNGRDIYSNENKSEQQTIFKACQWILDNKEG